jgi:hypothetical protein
MRLTMVFCNNASAISSKHLRIRFKTWSRLLVKNDGLLALQLCALQKPRNGRSRHYAASSSHLHHHPHCRHLVIVIVFLPEGAVAKMIILVKAVNTLRCHVERAAAVS